jgi:hypothetical protein
MVRHVVPSAITRTHGPGYRVLAGFDHSGVFGGNALAFTCLRVIHDLRLSATASATQSAATAEWM